MARKMGQYERNLLELRDKLWPDAAAVVWDRKEESGFSTVPRTLALIGTLQRHLVKSSDPSRVYLALWVRQRDNGLVEILNPEDLATEVGYSGTRKVRSLHEALDHLAKLGFIRVHGRGTRKYAFVLVLHPHDAVMTIKRDTPKRIPDWWWSLFELRMQEIKAVFRKLKAAPKKDDSFDEVPEALHAEDDSLPF